MLFVVLSFFALGGYLLYRLIRVPPELKHIPSAPLLKTIVSTFIPMTADKRRKYLYVDLLEKYGVVRQYINSQWEVVLGEPQIAEKLYLEPQHFPKVLLGEMFKNSLVTKFFGENLVHSNDDQWKKYRKVINKAFKKQFEPEIFASVVNELIQVIDSHNGKRIDMSSYLRRLTMEVLGLGLMDLKINAISSKDALFNHHYHNVVSNMVTPLTLIFKFLDHPNNPMMASPYKSLAYLDDFFINILNERREKLRANKEEPIDILSLLIQATENDKEFTDQELRDNIMTFVLAGHDTTALALAVAIYFLCKHPNIQEKAREEVLSVFGKPGADKKVPITNDQLKEVPFIDAVIKESMRYYPSVPRLPPRTNMNEFEVNGFTIPKNQILSLETIQFQRSSKYWTDPDKFDPYRFYGATNKDLVHPFAWSAFGGGQRMCIGMNFSLMEQRITLALLLLNYKLTLSTPVQQNAPLEKSLAFMLSSSDVIIDFEEIVY